MNSRELLTKASKNHPFRQAVSASDSWEEVSAIGRYILSQPNGFSPSYEENDIPLLVELLKEHYSFAQVKDSDILNFGMLIRKEL
jgi:hypothetical protein